MGWDGLTSSVGQIPSQTSPSVQPARVEAARGEEVPGRPRVDGGQIPVKDAPPATDDLVGPAVAEVRGPLLADELVAAHELRRRQQGQHVDALDVLGVRAEVGDVVDLVLEQDPRGLVANEA